MYAILEFDQMGLKDVDFRRVDYDVQKELQLTKDLHLLLITKCIMKVWSMASIILHNHELLHETSREKVMIE